MSGFKVFLLPDYWYLAENVRNCAKDWVGELVPGDEPASHWDVTDLMYDGLVKLACLNLPMALVVANQHKLTTKSHTPVVHQMFIDELASYCRLRMLGSQVDGKESGQWPLDRIKTLALMISFNLVTRLDAPDYRWPRELVPDFVPETLEPTL